MVRFLAALALLIAPSMASAQTCDFTLICAPGHLGINTGANGVLPGLSNAITLPTGAGYGWIFAGPTPGLNVGTNSQLPWTVFGTVTDKALDYPAGVLYAAKDARYSPAGAPASGEFPAFLGATNIANGTESNETGILGSVYNYNTLASQPGGTASAVAIHGTAWCEVANCSYIWGGVFSAYDITGQANPPNPMTGLEVNVYAHGTDTGQLRAAILIGIGTPDGLGADPVVSHGILFAPSNVVTAAKFGNLLDTTGTIQAVNGIVLNNVTFSGDAFLSPGFLVDSLGKTSTFSLTVDGNSTNATRITVTTGGTNTNVLATSAVTFTNGIVMNGSTFTNFAWLSPGSSISGLGLATFASTKNTPIATTSLPSCVAGIEGTVYFINDNASVPSYHGAIGAGSSINKSNVICIGGAWLFD